MTVGYSGTPLAKKLGIKPGHRLALIDEPDDFRSLLGDLGADVTTTTDLDDDPDVVVAFHTTHSQLESAMDPLAQAVFPDRVIWIAWPKQTSGLATDLTRDVIRETVLAGKLVDIKICAISETWSGLKVMWRREHR